jgi:hypothetical protein
MTRVTDCDPHVLEVMAGASRDIRIRDIKIYHARPYATVRRHQRLRWYAGLAVEFVALSAVIVGVVLAAGLAR